jgi:hypothetical protein
MAKLVEERLAIHWAAQIVAAAAAARIDARADFSHTNLGYDDALAALVSHPIGELRAGLVLAKPELIVVAGGEIAARRALAGATLAEGLAWLGRELDQRCGGEVALSLLDHDMPAHPVHDGGTFPEPTAAFAEVAGWFATAHAVVSGVASQNGEAASPARCWPHHFDLATLITVEPHDDPELAKSVGFGMTPGDAATPEPYFYATPWPRPEASALGELAVGEWHTDGWTGAVLRSTALVQAQAFAGAAVTACRALL